MRDWTEKHIRELVRRRAGDGDGGGNIVAESLLLRLWVYRCSQQPITTLHGGTIKFTMVKPTTSENLLATGKTLVRVDFTGCNWSLDYYINDPVGYMSAQITPYTIPSGSILESILPSLLYSNGMRPQYWVKPETYQTDEIYCDQVQTLDVKTSFGYEYAWNNANRTHYSTDTVVGRMRFRNVPSGTNTVSIFYLI